MSVPDEVKDLFGRIQQAETGGVPDPFIRTLDRTAPGGSSAYGPAQLTKSLAEGFKNNHPDIFNADELEYLDRFIEQGNKFLRFGNVKGLPKEIAEKYDYGGKGDLTSPEDQQKYMQVVEKMLNYYYEKFDGDMERIANVWRYGESDTRTLASDDPRYHRVLFGG